MGCVPPTEAEQANQEARMREIAKAMDTARRRPRKSRSEVHLSSPPTLRR
jgi:hypothetical protein